MEPVTLVRMYNNVIVELFRQLRVFFDSPLIDQSTHLLSPWLQKKG